MFCYQQTKPLIVFLSGWAGSGKDAAAALMVEEMGFVRHAFADSLKQDVATVTGIPVATFHSHYAKNKPLLVECPVYPTAQTPRDLLIQHAAAAREKNPNVYAEHVVSDILSTDHMRHVISDWRYPNEYEHIRDSVGSSAVIVRGRIHRSSVIPSTDPTEHYLDESPMDFIVKNDGSISELRDALKSAIHTYIHSSDIY